MGVGHVRHRAHCLKYSFPGLHSAHHQHDRTLRRETKLGLALRAWEEARRIDPVGDQRRVPAIPIALEVKRVGADQAFAGKEAGFRALSLCRPVSILGDEDVRRAALSKAKALAKALDAAITED